MSDYLDLKKAERDNCLISDAEYFELEKYYLNMGAERQKHVNKASAAERQKHVNKASAADKNSLLLGTLVQEVRKSNTKLKSINGWLKFIGVIIILQIVTAIIFAIRFLPF